MPSHEPAIEFICFLPTSWKQKSWLSGRRYRGRKLSHRGRINLLTLGPLWPVSLLLSSLSHDSPATCCFIQVRRCPYSHSGWSAELNSHHFQKAIPQHDKILQTLFLLMFWDFIYLFMSPFTHSFRFQVPSWLFSWIIPDTDQEVKIGRQVVCLCGEANSSRRRET